MEAARYQRVAAHAPISAKREPASPSSKRVGGLIRNKKPLFPDAQATTTQALPLGRTGSGVSGASGASGNGSYKAVARVGLTNKNRSLKKFITRKGGSGKESSEATQQQNHQLQKDAQHEREIKIKVPPRNEESPRGFKPVTPTVKRRGSTSSLGSSRSIQSTGIGSPKSVQSNDLASPRSVSSNGIGSVRSTSSNGIVSPRNQLSGIKSPRSTHSMGIGSQRSGLSQRSGQAYGLAPPRGSRSNSQMNGIRSPRSGQYGNDDEARSPPPITYQGNALNSPRRLPVNSPNKSGLSRASSNGSRASFRQSRGPEKLQTQPKIPEVEASGSDDDSNAEDSSDSSTSQEGSFSEASSSEDSNDEDGESDTTGGGGSSAYDTDNTGTDASTVVYETDCTEQSGSSGNASDTDSGSESEHSLESAMEVAGKKSGVISSPRVARRKFQVEDRRDDRGDSRSGRRLKASSMESRDENCLKGEKKNRGGERNDREEAPRRGRIGSRTGGPKPRGKYSRRFAASASKSNDDNSDSELSSLPEEEEHIRKREGKDRAKQRESKSAATKGPAAKRRQRKKQSTMVAPNGFPSAYVSPEWTPFATDDGWKPFDDKNDLKIPSVDTTSDQQLFTCDTPQIHNLAKEDDDPTFNIEVVTKEPAEFIDNKIVVHKMSVIGVNEAEANDKKGKRKMKFWKKKST